MSNSISTYWAKNVKLKTLRGNKFEFVLNVKNKNGSDYVFPEGHQAFFGVYKRTLNQSGEALSLDSGEFLSTFDTSLEDGKITISHSEDGGLWANTGTYHYVLYTYNSDDAGVNLQEIANSYAEVDENGNSVYNGVVRAVWMGNSISPLYQSVAEGNYYGEIFHQAGAENLDLGETEDGGLQYTYCVEPDYIDIKANIDSSNESITTLYDSLTYVFNPEEFPWMYGAPSDTDDVWDTNTNVLTYNSNMESIQVYLGLQHKNIVRCDFDVPPETNPGYNIALYNAPIHIQTGNNSGNQGTNVGFNTSSYAEETFNSGGIIALNSPYLTTAFNDSNYLTDNEFEELYSPSSPFGTSPVILGPNPTENINFPNSWTETEFTSAGSVEQYNSEWRSITPTEWGPPFGPPSINLPNEEPNYETPESEYFTFPGTQYNGLMYLIPPNYLLDTEVDERYFGFTDYNNNSNVYDPNLPEGSLSFITNLPSISSEYIQGINEILTTEEAYPIFEELPEGDGAAETPFDNICVLNFKGMMLNVMSYDATTLDESTTLFCEVKLETIDGFNSGDVIYKEFDFNPRAYTGSAGFYNQTQTPLDLEEEATYVVENQYFVMYGSENGTYDFDVDISSLIHNLYLSNPTATFRIRYRFINLKSFPVFYEWVPSWMGYTMRQWDLSGYLDSSNFSANIDRAVFFANYTQPNILYSQIYDINSDSYETNEGLPVKEQIVFLAQNTVQNDSISGTQDPTWQGSSFIYDENMNNIDFKFSIKMTSHTRVPLGVVMGATELTNVPNGLVVNKVFFAPHILYSAGTGATPGFEQTLYIQVMYKNATNDNEGVLDLISSYEDSNGNLVATEELSHVKDWNDVTIIGTDNSLNEIDWNTQTLRYKLPEDSFANQGDEIELFFRLVNESGELVAFLDRKIYQTGSVFGYTTVNSLDFFETDGVPNEILQDENGNNFIVTKNSIDITADEMRFEWTFPNPASAQLQTYNQAHIKPVTEHIKSFNYTYLESSFLVDSFGEVEYDYNVFTYLIQMYNAETDEELLTTEFTANMNIDNYGSEGWGNTNINIDFPLGSTDDPNIQIPYISEGTKIGFRYKPQKYRKYEGQEEGYIKICRSQVSATWAKNSYISYENAVGVDADYWLYGDFVIGKRNIIS